MDGMGISVAFKPKKHRFLRPKNKKLGKSPGLSRPFQAPRFWELVNVGCFPPKDPGLGVVFFSPVQMAELFMDYLGGGGNSNILLCSPRKIGEDEPILTHIFSNGLVQPPTRLYMGG